ncbi:ABC transporter ATP-binding protein [Niallia taxi]|uniref:ABC transporter ATP-binding protein n=1 Tax=Niallia taxi TaxID=2499688 RepID=UPI0023A91D3C|nr:ABC transporter ATP-binding protein [Niallia taxi]MDE5053991.1 ABC transporter ATP-binding protein [Niallia taxi]MED3963999.1 ABC transporter ATP-binding protein [Niallia taxi]
MEKVIELIHVSKQFQQHKAVNDISFTVNKGETVAILGANGAGKTTTILLMLGLLQPTNGTVRLFQSDPVKLEVRQKIGSMLQETSVMDSLKVNEVINLVQSYYPNPLSVQQLLSITGFSNQDWHKRTEKLSGGQKRRLHFALALAGNPDLIFLDEPTVGMDITARDAFWKTVKELQAQGKTIIFTTHYLQEADDIAERIIMISDGKVVGDGTPEELKAEWTKKTISFKEAAEYSLDVYHSLPFVEEVVKENGRITLVTNDSDKTIYDLIERKFMIQEIEIQQGKLEDAFSKLLHEKKEGI